MSATIAVTGVTKSFGDLAALAPIDLDVGGGEIVTVLGPSGSGKTTLLRIVGGLDEPSAGSVTVDGASPHVARAAKRIGFVPQSPALLPWRTVGANARLLLDVNRRHLTDGPDAVGWSPSDRSLLRAADEMVFDGFVSAPTWQELAAEYDDRQLMDIVFTVGAYELLAKALRTFGVEPEPDLVPYLPVRG